MMKKTQAVQKDKTLAYFIVVAIVSFAVYANSLNNQFVFDDDSVVLGDPTIMSLSNLPKFFTGDMGFHKVIGAYYRPAVSSTYAIDYALWKFNPFGFHLTNILIHVINSLLFFLLLRLMFKRTVSPFKDYALLIGALIFAVHPIHTEVAAWVSGRTDGLAATFFFAAFIYYLRYSESLNNIKNEVKFTQKPAYFFGMTVFMYLFALFSKEMAITLPAVILSYDMIVNRLNFRNELRQKLPLYLTLIVVSAVFMLWRSYVLSQVTERPHYLYFYGREFSTVIYTMLQTVPLYFRLAVAPYGMLYHYSGYMPYLNSPFEFGVIFAVIFIAVCAVAVFYMYKRFPFGSFAIALFFITLLPVMNLVPTMNFMADRFLYIPSMFLSILFAAVCIKYYTRQRENLILGISVLILVIFGYMTITRNMDWKDEEALFRSSGEKPGSVTYVNLGNLYAKKGQYDIAEVYYRKAIDLGVPTVLANTNLGKIYLIKYNFDSAYYYIHKSHLLDTLSPEPMHAMATLYARFEKYPEAIQWLERIQRITPNYMNSAEMLRQIKMEQQKLEQSKNFKSDSTVTNGSLDSNVTGMQRDKVMELEQISYLSYQQKQYDKAIKELNQLIALNPERAQGYFNNIGMCYMDQQKYQDAIASFNEAVKVDPKFSTGYNNLGQCYEKLNDKVKAAEYYKKAVDVDPANELAKQNYQRVK